MTNSYLTGVVVFAAFFIGLAVGAQLTQLGHQEELDRISAYSKACEERADSTQLTLSRVVAKIKRLERER